MANILNIVVSMDEALGGMADSIIQFDFES